MDLNFFLEMVPPTVTAQEHKIVIRHGRPCFYDPPELKAARADLMARLKQFAPKKPFDGAVALYVCWCFPAGSHKPGWKTTKPDTDNLQKLLKDCMTACGFWEDDALVCCEHVEKRWVSGVPGIFIKVTELHE